VRDKLAEGRLAIRQHFPLTVGLYGKESSRKGTPSSGPGPDPNPSCTYVGIAGRLPA
jgi:hypothetical protein